MVLPCAGRLLNETKMKRFERGINGENQRRKNERMCEKMKKTKP